MTYFITGASRGIGFELTKIALKAGHKVHVMVRNPAKSPGLAALKNEYPQLNVLKGDVTSESDIDQPANALSGEALDVVINNAGIFERDDDTFANLSIDKIRATIETNTLGPIRVTKALLPNLQKAKKPVLANITSLMGSIQDNSSGGYYGYRISKAALNMFVKSFSIDFPQITTLTLHPGWVKTEMGGAAAPVEPKDSAAGLFRIIEKAMPAQSGHFYDYTGKELPW